MKVKKVSKPTLECDTYLIAQAVNHNAEVLEDALNRISKLEKTKLSALQPVVPTQNWVPVSERLPKPYNGESENKECRGCPYNDGEVHAECVIENVIAEIDRQGEWLAEAGYNAYNVDIAFGSIIRALRKWLTPHR